MKIPFYLKVINKTSVEVDAGYQETIDRLRELSCGCTESDSIGRGLYFYCDENGKFHYYSLSNSRRRTKAIRTAYILGEVVFDKGKTRLDIYSVLDRSAKYFLYFYWVFASIIFLGLLAFLVFAKINGLAFGILDWRCLTLAILGIISVFVAVFRHEKEGDNILPDLEIMEKDILKRINAVERWDE